MPEVPLASFPEEPPMEWELIEDSDTPLAALPKTGDSRQVVMLWMMFGMAGIGALLSAIGIKKRDED